MRDSESIILTTLSGCEVYLGVRRLQGPHLSGYVVSPKGRKLYVRCLLTFCAFHNLSYRDMVQVMVGKRRHWQQWRLYKED